MRVLVVEDDESIAAGLRSHLRQLGHAVDIAGSVASGWAALQAEAFDLMLLDLGLPDGDGSELLRRLRQAREGGVIDPRLTVLIMSARDQVAERVAALDLGADDYVTKPFDPDELAARMRAAHRRREGRASGVIRCGALEIDPASRQVVRDGQPVMLAAREFDVLLALVSVRPRVLSRDQLGAKLYDWDNTLESNAIEVHVHHLRRKLGADVIRTLRGVGYFVPAEPP